jgi:transposase
MRKITEVLRLKAAGLGNREIAASIGAGKTTVYEILSRAEAVGLTWPLPDTVDEEQLDAVLYPPPTLELAERRPVPDWREVHRELKRKRHVTLRLLWLEWRETQPEGWGYTQFCLYYRQWLDVQDVVMRLSYRAGERMFVDFSGDTMEIVEQATGEITKAEVFVAVLGCSGLLYVEATRGQDLRSWTTAHVHAFAYYGGVAEVTVPDNLRSGVSKACFYDPELNPTYAELALHFGTVVLPTRVARPRDKAAVEAGVLVAERWVLAPLRNRRLFSLAEANEAIALRLAEVNTRPFRGEPASRRELFEELEKAALRPLPASPYEFAEWRKVTANIDYHVEGPDRRYYSVPYRLVRQRLDLRATGTTIEIMKGGKRVASHKREYGRRRYITDPEHMPASHRAHAEWTPSRLISWAGAISGDTAVLAEKMLDSRPHPEHAYRACLGLMSLARRYGNERVGAACARALALGTTSYSSVKSILAEGLDKVPLAEAEQLPPPPEHENLRGAGYFAEEA